MKKFFLVLWRVIRWIIYFVLIMLLPFIATFSYSWIKNKDADNFAAHYKTDLFNLNYQVVFAMGENDDPFFGVNDKLSIDTAESLFDLRVWKINFGFAENSGDADSIILKDTIVLKDNIVEFNDATFFLIGSLVVYIILFILMVLHVKKRNKRKALKTQGKDVKDSSIENEPIIENKGLDTITASEPKPEENKEEPAVEKEVSIEETPQKEEPKENSLEDEAIDDSAIFKKREEKAKQPAPSKQPDLKPIPTTNEARRGNVETKWCKYLADNGDPEAQYAFAVYCANGYKDVPRSEELAYHYLKLAASQGFEKAIKALEENE